MRVLLQIFLLVFLNPIAHSTIFTKQCGKYKFIVEMYHGYSDDDRMYKLYSQDGNQEKKLFYSSESGLSMYTGCLKRKKQDLLFFQEFCGGSHCSDYRYFVFDPKINTMLFNPGENESNIDEVKKFLGYLPPEPYEEKNRHHFFCCNFHYERTKTI